MSPTNANLAYAVQLVHVTCCLAGSASYLDDVRADLQGGGVVCAVSVRLKMISFDLKLLRAVA
jgi:hypothetical protein